MGDAEVSAWITDRYPTAMPWQVELATDTIRARLEGAPGAWTLGTRKPRDVQFLRGIVNDYFQEHGA
ncbi:MULTISPECIES: hypothetical protein [Nocardia]|uniref:hypothetical protein n=1 Tax=Nocardia TaxID=1817 RepID=UPI000D699DB2|nr:MULTISPECIES: hypothetical protein [Nocardia]